MKPTQIGGHARSVVRAGIPLLAAVAVTILLCCRGWQLYFLTAPIALALLVTAVRTVYRFLFQKITVSDDGILLQTRPHSVTFYPYSTLTTAYQSRSQTFLHTDAVTLHLRTPDGAFHFPLTEADTDAVRILLDRFARSRTTDEIPTFDIPPTPQQFDIRLDGKSDGPGPLLIIGFMTLFCTVCAVLQANSARPAPAIGFAISAAALANWFVRKLLRYCCLQIRIGADAFYLRTTPHNGRTYLFSDIRTVRERRASLRIHFADGTARTLPFAIDQSWARRTLLARIRAQA